jgi:hypothetical protein
MLPPIVLAAVALMVASISFYLSFVWEDER